MCRNHEWYKDSKIKVDIPKDFDLSDINSIYVNLNKLVIHDYNVAELLLPYRAKRPIYKHEQDLKPFRFIDLQDSIKYPNNESQKYFLDILLKLRSISSKKEQLKVFKTLLEHGGEVFTKQVEIIFDFVLSPNFVFHISLKTLNKEFDYSKIKPVEEHLTFNEILFTLGAVGANDLIPPSLKTQKIYELMYSCCDNTREIIKQIIDKDFKIGLQAKQLKHVIDVTIVPYMRCEGESKYDDRIDSYPVMGQEKCDGKFLNSLIDTEQDEIFFLNRSGNNPWLLNLTEDIRMFLKETQWHTKMSEQNDESIKHFFTKPTFHGEALIKQPDAVINPQTPLDIDVLDRRKGNGLFNSFAQRYSTIANLENELIKASPRGRKTKLIRLIQNLISFKRIESGMVLQLWTTVPLEDWKKGKNLTHRADYAYQLTQNFVYSYINWRQSKGLPHNILLNYCEIIKNKDHAYDFFNRMLSLGKEGIVVKRPDLLFEDGTSTKGMIKLKDFTAEADLEIIGFIPGEGKYVGGIGSLIGRTSCGKVLTSCAGLKRHEKGFERVDPNDSSKGVKLIDGWDNNCYHGKIMTVKFNEISIAEDSKHYAFSHGSVLEIRDDKTEADTLDKILSENKKLKLPS